MFRASRQNQSPISHCSYAPAPGCRVGFTRYRLPAVAWSSTPVRFQLPPCHHMLYDYSIVVWFNAARILHGLNNKKSSWIFTGKHMLETVFIHPIAISFLIYFWQANKWWVGLTAASSMYLHMRFLTFVSILNVLVLWPLVETWKWPAKLVARATWKSDWHVC